MYKTPLILSLMLLLGGCALLTGDAKRDYQFAPMDLHQAAVYVFDDIPGIIGPSELIVVNGTPVEQLSRRQYTWFHVCPGTVNLTLVDPAHPERVLASTCFVARRATSYYFRFRIVQDVTAVEVRGEGLSKDDKVIREWEESRDYRGDLVPIRESDAIALTETDKLVLDVPCEREPHPRYLTVSPK